jgi:hypothetical protein
MPFELLLDSNTNIRHIAIGKQYDSQAKPAHRQLSAPTPAR